MVVELKYIKRIPPEKYFYIFIFYLNSLDNTEIMFHQFLRWILRIMYKK